MKILNYLKAFTVMVGMLIISILVVVFGMPWWVNPVLNWVFIQMFTRFVCFVVGIKIEVIDKEKAYINRPVVYVGNHQSALDLALIGAFSPKNSVVVAKKEVVYIPIIGWYFKAAGNLFIDRSNKFDSHTQMDHLADILVKKNLAASIFPEGTRNKKSNEVLLPFKKGAFHIAFSKGLPIIPVVCSSLKGIAVLERFELSGGKVIVKVLDPIETKDVPKSEMGAFIERVRELMQLELNKLNEQVRNTK